MTREQIIADRIARSPVPSRSGCWGATNIFRMAEFPHHVWLPRVYVKVQGATGRVPDEIEAWLVQHLGVKAIYSSGAQPVWTDGRWDWLTQHCNEVAGVVFMFSCIEDAFAFKLRFV